MSRSRQASDIPCTCSAMPELMSGGTTVPMMDRVPRSEDARWSGTKPTSSITFMIRSRVSGATRSGLRSALETVIGATPERRAIDRMSGVSV